MINSTLQTAHCKHYTTNCILYRSRNTVVPYSYQRNRVRGGQETNSGFYILFIIFFLFFHLSIHLSIYVSFYPSQDSSLRASITGLAVAVALAAVVAVTIYRSSGRYRTRKPRYDVQTVFLIPEFFRYHIYQPFSRRYKIENILNSFFSTLLIDRFEERVYIKKFKFSLTNNALHYNFFANKCFDPSLY